MKPCIQSNILKGMMAVFIGLAIFTILPAQEPSPLLLKKDRTTLIKDLKTLIPELMKQSRVPGLQVAVIRDGQIIWSQGFGVKNFKTGEPVTEDTIFEAASLTKPFFAYAAMKLVEAGVLDLDKPLIEYLPREQIEKELGHSLDEKGFRCDWFEKITGRHVLSHSGGMPHGESGKPYPLFFEPGTKYKYSAAGYYFLQLIVERLRGEKLETIMQKLVLNPLGMKKSWMVWKDEYEKTMANGHGFFNKPENFRKRTRAYASATLYTTASEYARFVCAVLNGEGIKKETLKTMLTPQIDVSKEKGLSWSLGFGLQEDKNGNSFWQWGDYGIFRNYILAYPESRIGVVYLTNSFHGLSICQKIITTAIGGNATGVAFLDYEPYDSPVYEFAWAVKDQGPEAVDKLLPGMKAKHPKKFSARVINGLSSIMTSEKLYDEVIALRSFSVKENPGSVKPIIGLARAYLEKGDLGIAKSTYEKALELDKEKKKETKTINWALDYIKALEEQVKLSTDYLKKLAGDYETRHVKFKDGSLYYFRENTAAKDYRRLIPLSKDTFILKELIFFRLRFEFDAEGLPTKIIGLYERGDQDQSVRDK